MSPIVVRSIRAHLVAASIAATLIDAGVLVSMGVFDVSENTFQTPEFRFMVLSAVVVALMGMRLAAFSAYRIALRMSYVYVSADRTLYVRPVCRLRALVMMHFRLAGLPFEDTFTMMRDS